MCTSQAYNQPVPTTIPRIENRVLVTFGYPDTDSPRYRNICAHFAKEGYTIRECHTKAQGMRAKWRDLRSQWKEKGKDANAVLVTFPGHYLVPLAWKLTRKPRMKLYFDAFISLSDSLVSDRQKVSWLHPYAWFLYALDVVSCHLADTVLIDTASHAEFFQKAFFLKPERVEVLYLGTREDLFYPETKTTRGKHVLFYGTYIPLQGIPTILEAAKILQSEDPEISFTLIGSGQTYSAMRTYADTLKLTNCMWVDVVPYHTLPDWIRKADVALGIFGDTKKAARVIPHKVYDAVACGIPVITRDSPAIREKFSDGKKVILCEPANPTELAKKIVEAIR